MKKSLLLIAMIALFAAPAFAKSTVAAAAAAPAPTAQESKMKQCATAYHARKIEKSQYRAFMSGCLKKGADPATVAIPATPSAKAVTKAVAAPMAPSAPAAVTPASTGMSQKDKMQSCNDNAKTQNLSGDARKAFMKTCLSN